MQTGRHSRARPVAPRPDDHFRADSGNVSQCQCDAGQHDLNVHTKRAMRKAACAQVRLIVRRENLSVKTLGLCEWSSSFILGRNRRIGDRPLNAQRGSFHRRVALVLRHIDDRAFVHDLHDVAGHAENQGQPFRYGPVSCRLLRSHPRKTRACHPCSILTSLSICAQFVHVRSVYGCELSEANRRQIFIPRDSPMVSA